MIIVDVTIDEATESNDTHPTEVIPLPPPEPEPEQQTGLLLLATPHSVEPGSDEAEEDLPDDSANDDAMERFLDEGPSFVDTAQTKVHDIPESTPSDTKQRSWLSEPVAITPRAVGVVLALVALGIGIIGFAGWYGRSGYHVGVAGDDVVVYQGRIGGLWWFDPTLEERTGVLLSELTEDDQAAVADGHSTESLTGAHVYVEELRTRVTTVATADTSTDEPQKDPAGESDESPPTSSAG